MDSTDNGWLGDHGNEPKLIMSSIRLIVPPLEGELGP